MDSLTIYKQWKKIHVPANHKGSKNDKYEEPVISKQVAVGEVCEDFQQHFELVAAHVDLKQIQADAFQNDSNDVDTRVLQIDYATAYLVSNKAKSKVHYGQEAVSIYLCVLCITKTKPKHS